MHERNDTEREPLLCAARAAARGFCLHNEVARLLLSARLIYAFLQLLAPIQPDLTLADAK